MDNRTRFHETYAKKLAERIMKYPEEYFYDLEKVDDVAGRMTEAFAKGDASMSANPTVKAVCHALSIKCNLKSIKEYLNS